MRLLIRAVFVVILLVAGGFLLLGYWAGNRGATAEPAPKASVGTSGTIDTAKARERGAEIGEKTAIAAEKAQETISEAGVSAKIKAKMALDDRVRARDIGVSTSHSTVTLSGTVRSVNERNRALALARETSGVTEVVDHLTVAR